MFQSAFTAAVGLLSSAANQAKWSTGYRDTIDLLVKWQKLCSYGTQKIAYSESLCCERFDNLQVFWPTYILKEKMHFCTLYNISRI